MLGDSYFTRKHATAYELTGWVRNTKEGKVSGLLHHEKRRQDLTMSTRLREKHRAKRPKSPSFWRISTEDHEAVRFQPQMSKG